MFIEIRGITKHFGEGENRVEVLKGIDMKLDRGRSVCRFYSSGSGKSTLLNILGGIDSADGGYISIDGEKIEEMSEKELTLYRRKHLGYVFQMYNLIPNLNIRENEETKEIDSTLRIFQNRTEIDLVCLMDGKLPEKADEIAIDRMYADNNGIRTGDSLKAGTQILKVTGLVALSDYSALFSDTSDLMFDAVKFGVAVMTEEGFDALNQTHLHFNYSWKYNSPPADDKEAKRMAEDFLESLTKKASVTGFIPEFMNQAIIFTGDDLGETMRCLRFFFISLR